ncbi:DNA repair ATPase [Nocardia sp. NPDC051832]|uniref:DNA repair ATPase n=1 Tax=Nocardia sp. NPDC051832 TaxID=3155673 RepID=UPI003414D99E
MSAATARHTEATDGAAESAPSVDTALDGGTYDVLRARLRTQAAELTRRCEQLNDRRIEGFGGTELTLLGTERIRTEHNCVPRDIAGLPDGRMMFGYNVFLGMKPETAVEDVFAVHRFHRDGARFSFETADPAALLDADQFCRDFAELYRYYSQTRLLQLRRVEGRLLAVFQTGQRTDDIKVLRWRTGPDGTVAYQDNRGERDHVFPPAHEFDWTESTREDQVLGRHPHLSILGEVFVETLGGTLTIKIENNTETGAGIYAEPVAEPLQSLADADVHYVRVGALILLRIRPYNETDWRYLVFNTKTKTVVRLDGIGLSCRLLPEDQGIIFPGGYYLSTGVHKTFDTAVADLEYERTVRATNGEDVLYVFHARAEGRTLLLPYNVIRKQVANPITCHGYSLFDDGTMVVFRSLSDEPARVHPMQVWQTPFVSDLHAARQPAETGPLARVGNAELVRGISDCLSVARMVDDMAPATPVFEAMIAACTRAADHHHWLADPELEALAEPLAALRESTEQVLAEFEKVAARTAQAATALDEAARQVDALVRASRSAAHSTADGWVHNLAELHQARGHLASLRELRYADADRLGQLTTTLDGAVTETGRRAVRFLGGTDAFAGYRAEIDAATERAGQLTTVAGADPIRQWLAEQTEGLHTVTEVVATLDIADATERTRILAQISTVLGGVNRARAILETRRTELAAAEGRAEFAAEFGLLGQAIPGALAAATTPDACDEQLAKLLLAVENLETRFGEFDDYTEQLAGTREDVYEAFATRKQALLDERSRRADRLTESTRRILSSVQHRCTALASLDEVNTYFATDPLVKRLRKAVAELRALGEVVRAEELDGRITAARQEAGRALRDRLDLYADDGETIRLGRHLFAVNTQNVDLALVPHDDSIDYVITGTDYRMPLRDSDFADTAPYWSQRLASETTEVYRAEHLAMSILAAAESAGTLPALHQAVTDGALATIITRSAEQRYDEGYERGVHDHDATAILTAALRVHAGAGLLRFPPAERAAAQLWWQFGTADAAQQWGTRITALARVRAMFGGSAAIDQLRTEIATGIGEYTAEFGLAEIDHTVAAAYLFEEIAGEPAGFATSTVARTLVDRFHRALRTARSEYERDLKILDSQLILRHQLISAWLTAFLEQVGELDAYRPVLPEAVAIELCGPALPRHDSSAELSATVPGLLGVHPRITHRELTFRLDELAARCHRFRSERVPGFRAYLHRRNELLATERHRLRLAEFQPTVPNGFVRNRLLDEVYLPLIGDNLAKQLGATGAAKRIDQSGLLLLISPPGYGKTTLVEYVAARLGLVLVKVNGPALGHGVRSLDPRQAPDATARQEVEKINFALELGNNVLLYLDDIQHTSPELLQKFISLCDGQRRIEGVRENRSRTYDLRGKRFAVCMAGNPYTEQGRRFRIPDMLANRADVWNLGDVLSGREELFALSYLENALTANPVLAPLSSRDRADLELLIRLARGDETARTDQLRHPYSAAELSDLRSVLGKMLRVQQVVLTVNQAYIASAATADAGRTEPPFQLQGSYRNMNALTERIIPVMDDEELEALIDDHYTGEAQTLAGGAEANLLKLAELRDRLTPAQAERWTAVKSAYLRDQALGGGTDDPLARAIGGLSLLADRIGAIESAIRALHAGPPTGNHAAHDNSSLPARWSL